jgi:hypothetical protein
MHTSAPGRKTLGTIPRPKEIVNCIRNWKEKAFIISQIAQTLTQALSKFHFSLVDE